MFQLRSIFKELIKWMIKGNNEKKCWMNSVPIINQQAYSSLAHVLNKFRINWVMSNYSSATLMCMKMFLYYYKKVSIKQPNACVSFY